MRDFSQTLKNIDAKNPDADAQIQKAYENLEKNISSDRLVAAFLQLGKLFDGLDALLKYSITNFDFIGTLVLAISEVQNALDKSALDKVPLSTFQLILDPILYGPKPAQKVGQDLVLSIIALYTNYQGDSYYSSGDLAAIRKNYVFIDKAVWDAWIKQQNSPSPSSSSSSSS